ncbi:MAG: hypothetical protein Q4G27_00470 [Flavobacteriaceae bacterium]|nr:hypothetical protein [Flavobacteriaceae bacterium]
MAQSSLEVQNSILKQYEKLIPKDSSFASWTMYEVYLNDDKVKDYVFSYILCKKNQRHIHSGSGVLMLETVGKNKFKIYGHIPASGKDIYTFTGYSGNTYFINEYSAASNYSKIKRQIKFEKRGEKLIAL